MAKNERIIAQDLAELRHAIQTQNVEDIGNFCQILKREISKYPVSLDLTGRLNSIADYHNTSDVDLPLDERVNEITNMIDILTSY